MNCKIKKLNIFFMGLLAIAVLFCAVVFILTSCGESVPAGNTNVDREYTEIENFVGYDLESTLDFLRQNGIEYEIVPTPNEKANKIVNVEFEGYEKDNLLYIEKNTKVLIYANRVESNGKVVYLTFDDGPTRDNTFDILEILEEYDAKATFFVLGSRMSEYGDRMKAIYNGGHEIGCHSFSHNIDRESEGFIYASVDAFISEVDKYESQMKAVFGEENFNSMPKLLRFPGGSYSNGRLTDDEVALYIDAVHNMGYTVYDWTILTNDAATQNKAEDESYKDFYLRSLEESIKKANDYDLPLILLMHDQKHTKENLRDILDYLVSKGYTFELLSKCPEYTFSRS